MTAFYKSMTNREMRKTGHNKKGQLAGVVGGCALGMRSWRHQVNDKSVAFGLPWTDGKAIPWKRQ